MTILCFNCKKNLPFTPGVRPTRRDTCSHCGSDVHVCLNCEFYDQGSHHECREPQAEWVKNKDRSNVCDYFRFNTKSVATKDDKDAKLKALDDLFK